MNQAETNAAVSALYKNPPPPRDRIDDRVAGKQFLPFDGQSKVEVRLRLISETKLIREMLRPSGFPDEDRILVRKVAPKAVANLETLLTRWIDANPGHDEYLRRPLGSDDPEWNELYASLVAMVTSRD
jgi:hypothetical protein